MITTLNEKNSNLNNQLSKEKSTISSLQEEKKKLKSDFKIREDELPDKQIQLEIKIKELDNILEAAKFVRDFKSLAKEADESLAKHKALEFEIKSLLRVVVSQDIMSIVQSNSILDTSNLQTKLDRTKEKLENCIIKKEKEYDVLWNNWYTKCKECKYDKISYDKAYNDMQQKIERLQALLGDLKGKSKDTPGESDTLGSLSQKLENENVELEINPSKTSREYKFVPINKVRASVRTNPITVSQPYVITKKQVIFDSNGLSSTGVDNTAKTRRLQPRSNTKNDRVPSAFMSSCIKHNKVDVEEHHRNLLLSKNKKHMSSECNNIKLAIRNDKSEVICAMCKQCLITSNNDVCVLNYVNDMNSHVNNLYASVSKTANQKKHKPKVTKPKKVVQICLWCVDSGCSKHMTRNLELLINFVWKFLGIVRFGNDHVPAILGYGDLQWGNILITRVYFVESLRHNLLLVGQFCDSDLEVAFRRNTCFVRNLQGVDLLKGNHTTNLYTIKLHEMASISPICLMARAISTKSWLWHQRLSHLNFDTRNNLAKNDLVTGLLKFKYHKEHLCPSCEQGKSKKASHPPKLVPNSKQKLHLLHMDLCGPMRVKSINGKQYILVIVDDYSRYTWVYFLISKDEAPEKIKTFLKKIIVLLQAPVIIVRTDNGTEFKNQVLKEYFDSVGISHQASSVRTP
ncbi:retrovirus-related pol polyprotein from transposon TNT 1-94 [Tanacetum coccineum]